jgi:hypothetical protein
MLALALCTLTGPAQVSASHRPSSHAIEYVIEIADPDHGHAEPDTAMLEYSYLDLHSPTITGGELQSQQSLELLLAANGGMRNCWAETAIGKRLVLIDLLRDLRAERRQRLGIFRPTRAKPLSSSLPPPASPPLAQGRFDGSTYPTVSSRDIAFRMSARFLPALHGTREGCCGRNAERLERMWSSYGWAV